MSNIDEKWMDRALELAERGRGYVEPNPLVGAVIVRDGKCVGEGYHQKFGEAHAEVNALHAAGDAARDATMYVTLEPCCHQGKTPPCTEAVIAAGINRVVIAMADPFSEANEQGITQLREHGIRVDLGVREMQARKLNAPYLKLIEKRRPYVHAKWAMTIDGKIATRTGVSKWISNEASRRIVHKLRGRMDAIIIGIGTALADDPMLNARPPGPRIALRVVLDNDGRLPLDSNLVRTARDIPTLIVSGKTLDQMRRAEYEKHQVGVLEKLLLSDLLEEFGRRRYTNVLVEGGAEILGSFVDCGEIDEAHVFIAPKLVGGRSAKTAIAGNGLELIADALEFNAEFSKIDGDVYWHGIRATRNK